MNKGFLSGVAGLMDPVLINLARSLADRIPMDSQLRSQFVESIMGAARGVLETQAEKFPILAAVFTEKTTDVLKFMSATLGSNQNLHAKNDPLQQVLATVAERLQQAENPEQEKEKIIKELKLINEIMEVAYPKKDPAAETSQLSLALDGINQRLEKFRDNLKAKEV